MSYCEGCRREKPLCAYYPALNLILCRACVAAAAAASAARRQECARCHQEQPARALRQAELWEGCVYVCRDTAACKERRERNTDAKTL